MNRGNNTLSNGNTFVTGGSNWNTTLCTGVIESGKWFVELTHKGRQSASDNDIQFGLFGLNDPEDSYPLGSTKDLAAQSTGYVIVDAQANWYNNSSSTSYGKTWSNPGDVVGLRYNADTGKLGFIINGVDQGDISTTLSTSQRWVVGISLRGGGAKAEINFGQKPFKFPPPDGFQLLNNANTRLENVISRPNQYVGITTWTGDGNDNRNITLMDGFDLLWYKQRSGTQYHYLEDTIRGASRSLFPNDNSGQSSPDSSKVKSFTRDGIVVGTDGAVNQNTERYVAWTWKAGGRKNTFNVDDIGYSSASDAGLDGGSIDPTGATVGTKQGFSMITITTPSAGAYTVSHGLTKAPDFIIYRIYDQAMSWYVWHQGYGSAKSYTLLNANSTVNSGTYVFNNTLPTASVITDYSSNSLHHNEGRAMLYYSWHDVPGLQKFGTFEGNTQTDGPYIELGFKPALVLLKTIDTAANWMLYDNEKGKYNPNSFILSPNVNDGGQTYDAYSGEYPIDFLSNGFKIRTTVTNSNADSTIIYAAWAEAPSIDLYGGGANAR